MSRLVSPEITFVSHDAGRAGAQRLLLTLVRWLRDSKGMHSRIVLRRGGPLIDEFRELGPVFEVEPLLATSWEEVRSGLLDFCDKSSLIYINTLVPGDIAEILSELEIPIVTHAHEMEHAIQRWCAQDQLEVLLKVTDYFIAASPPVAENLQRAHRVEAQRIRTIYEFISSTEREIEALDRAATRSEKQLPEHGFIVFGCGMMDWRKGPDLFVEVAQHAIQELKLPDAYFFWIGGAGSELEAQELQNKIDGVGLSNQVKFFGEVPDPRNYFTAGDVFVLTSREDPFPLVCLEAADCGLPIICFDQAGGMPDFVRTDAGYVIPFGNTNAMAEKVSLFYADPEERSRCGGTAQKRVRSQYDVARTGQSILQVILLAIVEHQRRALLAKDNEIDRQHGERSRLEQLAADLGCVIETQKDSLLEKEAILSVLRRDQEALTDRLRGLNIELDRLREETARIEAKVAASELALSEEVSKLASVQAERIVLVQKATQLDAALSSALTELTVRDQKIHAMELAQSGLLWRLVTLIRGIKNRCLPEGTRRRLLYDNCLRLVKIQFHNGLDRRFDSGIQARSPSLVSASDFLYSIDSLALRVGRVYGWGWLLHKTDVVCSLRLVARTRQAVHYIECQYGVRRDDVSLTQAQARGENSGFLILGRLPQEKLVELYFEAQLAGGGTGRLDCEDLELIARSTQLNLHSVVNGKTMNGARKLIHFGRRGIDYLARRDWRGLQTKIQKRIERSRISGTPLPVFSLPDFLNLTAPREGKEFLLLIDHNLGGGANIYRERLIKESVNRGRPVLLLFYNLWRLQYCLQYFDHDRDEMFVIESLDSIVALSSSLNVNEIFLNNTVSFDDPLTVVTLLPHLKSTSGADLTIAIHDFFAVCPSWNLLDDTDRYCGVPNINRCRECLPNLGHTLSFWVDGKTIDQWRKLWGDCLQEATQVLCFSRSSMELLRRAYPDLESGKILYKPHVIEDFPCGKMQRNVHSNLNIGIVGEISTTKGARVVAEMVQVILERKLPVKLTVIGTIDGLSESGIVSITGPYKRQDLPTIIEQTEANVFFVPSIWPETFSFVTAELMQMGLPVACFNLGAQAERVGDYPRGLVIKEMTGDAALDQLIAFHTLLRASASVGATEDLSL